MQLETLKRKSEFNRIYSEGRTASSKFAKFYIQENDLGMMRVGISVGKNVGNAVTRNRIKRIIKEVLRKIELNDKGLDLLIVVRKASAGAGYHQLKQVIENSLLSAFD